MILGYKTSLSTVDAKQIESHSPLTLEYGAGPQCRAVDPPTQARAPRDEGGASGAVQGVSMMSTSHF